MQTANVWIELDPTLRNNTPKFGITPPEASILWSMFGNEIDAESGRSNPFVHVDFRKDVDTSDAAEYMRLTHLYGKKKVKEVFPGGNPKLPQTFKDIGLDETEDAAPKSGKKHEIAPLLELPVGDLTDEEKLEMVSAHHPMDATLAAHKADLNDVKTQLAASAESNKALQAQVASLAEMVKSLTEKKAESKEKTSGS